jgi:hypothetical protein
MLAANTQPTVFLSYAPSDRRRADAMQHLLEAAGTKVLAVAAARRAMGDTMLATIGDALSEATVTVVLIGPQTRSSRWVDKEIELAMQGTANRPPTGLVAVILPEHEDYSRPFYDPENVPLRIHEHVSRESAILRKWTENPDELQSWIAEATQRRRRFPAPFVNFSTQSALNQFDWDASVDEASPEDAP